MRKFAAAVFAISLPCLLHAQELKITEVPVFGMRADAIAVDAQGIVWAADFVYSTLHRVARDGTCSGFWVQANARSPSSIRS